MPDTNLAIARELGQAIVGPPHDLAAAQALCDLLEHVLAAQLKDEPTWSPSDWLDGVVPTRSSAFWTA